MSGIQSEHKHRNTLSLWRWLCQEAYTVRLAAITDLIQSQYIYVLSVYFVRATFHSLYLIIRPSFCFKVFFVCKELCVFLLFYFIFWPEVEKNSEILTQIEKWLCLLALRNTRMNKTFVDVRHEKKKRFSLKTSWVIQPHIKYTLDWC